MGIQQERGALLDLITRAAEAGAAIIREGAGRLGTIDWQSKGPGDFVSEVDLRTEAAILALLRPALPGVTILAEESASSAGAEARRGLCVVIDPLDGTTNFLHGFPEYAVSIGVLEDGHPVAAVVLQVPRNERFTATLGAGALVDGRPCRVSTITDPPRALIASGFPAKDPHDLPLYQLQLARVISGVPDVRRAGAASLDLASVAAGRVEAYWETRLSPWDFAAGMLLVTEAGGIVSTVDGEPLDPTQPSSILAGNPVMHPWLRERLHDPLHSPTPVVPPPA
ncbi:MAG: inositol monophosphatase family protein [Gemmatimonadota bacterium]|jgi:myo-inositol-1(or 4)-monophosphatase